MMMMMIMKPLYANNNRVMIKIVSKKPKKQTALQHV